MPAGLQTWNADGTLQIDITTQLTTYLGQVTIGLSAGQINDVRLRNGTAWFFFSASTGLAYDTDYPLVTINKAAGTISWSSRVEGGPMVLAYGVF